MTAAVFDCPVALFEQAESNAVSPEAGCVRTLFKQAREVLWDSVSLGAARDECRKRLFEAWSEALTPDWDGYSAQSANSDAAFNALRFIDALPNGVPIPEITVDPDGEISFDWYGGRRRQFSISLGPHNVLSYAGIFGSDRARGSERFQDGIPRTLLYYAKRASE